MSADNMIYIQKRGKKWWVWMGFASDERKPKPKETDVSFSSYPEAHAYAQGWYYGEWVVEYGIVELDPE